MKYLMNFRRAGRALCAVATSLACYQLTCQAQVVTLTDGNSLAQIDPHSQAGMFNWSVQGLNQLYQQWFWYRVGDATGAMQHSIDTISAPVVTLYGTREATILYTANTFTFSVDYLLTGGSVILPPGEIGNPDLGESIRIVNTRASTLAFHLFQYAHCALSGYPSSDSVQLGRNLHGFFNDAFQSDPAAGLTQAITSLGANHGEVDFAPATLGRLNSVNGYNLNDNAGPVGPGDVAYAFQWDLNIAPGASAVISMDTYLMVSPEPSAPALMVCSLVAWAMRRRLFRKPRT